MKTPLQFIKRTLIASTLTLLVFSNHSAQAQQNLKLDSTFAGNGIYKNVVTNNYISSTSASAIQSDGKIVTAGFLTDYTTAIIDSFAVFRFNTDGTLDASFGIDGMTSVTVPSAIAYNNNVTNMTIQPDGKILVLGYVATSTGNATLIIRFQPNGDLDSSFAVNGVATHAFYPYEGYSSIGLQSTGKIVIGGFMAYDAYPRAVLARYNADGSPDTLFDATYGADKILDSLYNDHGSLSYNMTIGNDDKIVIDFLGMVHSAGDGDIGLLRLDADGNIDASFGNSGRTDVQQFTGTNPVSTLLHLPGGKYACSHADLDSVYFRVFNADGSYDPTFNQTGQLGVAYPNPNYGAWATLLPLNNNNFVYSHAQFDSTVATINYSSQVLVGIQSNGSIITTFGTNGSIRTGLGIDGLMGKGCKQSDGKLVFPGFSGDSRGFCMRYTDAPVNTTAVAEYGRNAVALHAFPNPANSETSLYVSSPKDELVSLFIADITGKIILTKQINTNENNSLDLYNLQRGIYLISATVENGVRSTVKLLVE